MADRVRMTAASVFANDRLTIFAEGGPPEGVKGGTVTDGVPFETDLDHARDLHRLGLAKADNETDLEGETGPLEPHYTLSNMQLAASQSGSSDGGLRNDGPTVDEYVARGYRASNYPPRGYASRSTAEEIAAAVSRQGADTKGDGLEDMTVAELRDHAASNSVDLGEARKKDEILTALRAGLASKTETA